MKGRRKCNRCGKYGHPQKDDMVHTGYGRVMYSEAHFAHRKCLDKDKAKALKPMTALTEDWAEHTWPMKIGNTEYEVRCHVYLTFKEVPDPYNVTGRDTQVADYNLETWDCLPPLKPEHEKEIERQLLQLLEEFYATH